MGNPGHWDFYFCMSERPVITVTEMNDMTPYQRAAAVDAGVLNTSMIFLNRSGPGRLRKQLRSTNNL
jgi:hypothetical protein